MDVSVFSVSFSDSAADIRQAAYTRTPAADAAVVPQDRTVQKQDADTVPYWQEDAREGAGGFIDITVSDDGITETKNRSGSAADKTRQNADIEKITAELKVTDTKVRAHELAHMSAGAGLITSGASFTYEKGPDGRQYAVAGEVGIDTSPVAGDPEATIAKMRQVRSAAMAPANPSAQDLSVAAAASVQEAQAQMELAAQTRDAAGGKTENS